MAGDLGHQAMTRKAMHALPPRIQKWLAPHADEILNLYCLDTFQHTEAGRRLMALPGGGTPFYPWELRELVVPAPGQGKDVFHCGYYDQSLATFMHFLTIIADGVANNNGVVVAQATGLLAHFVEDMSTPVHATGTSLGDMDLLRLLCAPGDYYKRALPLHTLIENLYPPFESHASGRPAEVLGVNVGIASLRALGRLTDLLEHSLGILLPAVQAYLRGDIEQVSGLLERSARPAVTLVADLLATAFHVGAGTGEHAADDSLALFKIPARRWTAYAPGYPYHVIRRTNASLDNQLLPCPIQLRDGNMPLHGFGVGAPFEIMYRIPPHAFRSLQCQVGHHAALGIVQPVIAEIRCDDQPVWQVELKPGDGPHDGVVELNGAVEISFVTYPSKAMAGKINHVVWGNPELLVSATESACSAVATA